MNRQMLLGMMMVAATTGAVSANDRAVRYEFGDRADVRIVTDVVATEAGVAQWRHRLSEGSHPEEARAIDRASGKPLAIRIDGSDLVVELGRALPANAQQRLRIEEVASLSNYVKGQGPGAALVFEHRVEGRVTLALPPGYGVTSCSLPAQYAIEEGRLEVGILAIDRPIAVRLEAAVGPSAPTATLSGSFRVADDRTIVYWLEDPSAQRISLALEMLITQPGQAHVYSVLRKEDNITNPRTVDVDRGIELPDSNRDRAGSHGDWGFADAHTGGCQRSRRRSRVPSSTRGGARESACTRSPPTRTATTSAPKASCAGPASWRDCGHAQYCLWVGR